MTRRLLAVGLALVALVGLAVVLLGGEDPRPPRTIEVVVPPGTGDPRNPAPAEELLPRRLEVQVGDRLIIDNRSDRAQQVGPYVVAAEQRLEQTFTDRGVLRGECTLHPSGQVTIVVT